MKGHISQDQLKSRKAHIKHVQATNLLEGVRISPYMDDQIQRYLSGDISSKQLVEAAKNRHIKANCPGKPIHDKSTKPKA